MSRYGCIMCKGKIEDDGLLFCKKCRKTDVFERIKCFIIERYSKGMLTGGRPTNRTKIYQTKVAPIRDWRKNALHLSKLDKIRKKR